MSGWWGYPEPNKELEKEFEMKNAEKESRMQFPKIDQMAREYAKYASEREEQTSEITQAELDTLKRILDSKLALSDSVVQKLNEKLEECKGYFRIIDFLNPPDAERVAENFRDWLSKRD